MSDDEPGFVVSPAEAGERLDRLVVRHFPSLGRRRARELFERGKVRSDGQRLRGGTPAIAGQAVSVAWEDELPTLEPELPLDVRLETDTVLVVHKPAGQPSAPLEPGERGTLANVLLGRYPELAGVGHRRREPGLVHRLDTETSGLLVVARSAAAFVVLNAGLKAGRLVKRYLAVTAPAPLAPSGQIDEPLGPDPTRRGRVRVAPDPGREYARDATTRYRVLERTPRGCLVELEAARAFRHQIRAHLAALGAPLVGDELYGGPAWPEAGARHALHASYVAWAGDRTVPSFAVNADLPLDMRRLVDG